MSDFNIAMWMVIILFGGWGLLVITGTNFVKKKMKEEGIEPIYVFHGIFGFGRKEGKLWFAARHGQQLKKLPVQQINILPVSKDKIKVTIVGENGGSFDFETPSHNRSAIQNLQLNTMG